MSHCHFLLALLIGVGVTFSAARVAGPGPIVPNDLEFVGNFGNKLFFKDDDFGLQNWFAARERCRAGSLVMAEFENYAEYSYVRSALGGSDTQTFNHWTGAHLTGIDGITDDTRSAFSWLSGNGTVSRDLPFHHDYETWLCVYADWTDHMFVDFCGGGRRKVLCQFVPS